MSAGPRTRVLQRLRSTQLVLLEVAGAAVLWASTGPGWVLIVAGAVALPMLVMALGRREGRWLYQWLPIRLAYLSRRRVARRNRPADLLGGLSPGCRMTTATSHWGASGAVMTGAGRFAIALELQPIALLGPVAPAGIRLGDLARTLSAPDLAIAGARLVSWVTPAPAQTLPAHALARRSYAALTGTPPPWRRRDWLVLSLDPQTATDAVAARGDGEPGAASTLLAAANRAVTWLAAEGTQARPLQEREVMAALADATGGRSSVAGQPAESWQACEIAGTLHSSFWVDGWPTGADGVDRLLAAVEAVGASSVAVAVTAEPGQHENVIQAAVTVRLSASTAEDLTAAAGELRSVCAASGVRCRRLDGEQLAGATATLPMVAV